MRQEPAKVVNSEVVNLMGMKAVLFSALKDLKFAASQINPSGEASENNLSKLKFSLETLQCYKREDFDEQLIRDRLFTLVRVLANKEVRKSLNLGQEEENRIKGLVDQVYSAFSALVPNTPALSDILPLKISDTGSLIDEPNSQQDAGFSAPKLYKELYNFLCEIKGLKNNFHTMCKNNPAKRTALRVLLAVIHFHYPEPEVWEALRLLVLTSEPSKRNGKGPGEARQKFGKYFNEQYQGFYNTLNIDNPNLDLSLDLTASAIKIIDSEKDDRFDQEIKNSCSRLRILLSKEKDVEHRILLFRTLIQLMRYNYYLESGKEGSLEKTSFFYYKKMGVKAGVIKNLEKQNAIKDLCIAVFSRASTKIIIEAMDRFVFFTTPSSNGAKIFGSFYREICLQQFPQLEEQEENKDSFSLLPKKDNKIENDEDAYFVLRISLSSAMGLHNVLFKEALFRGKANTLGEMASRKVSEKSVKSFLIELKTSLQGRAGLNQLLVIISEIIKASENNSDHSYAPIIDKIRQIKERLEDANEKAKKFAKEFSKKDSINQPNKGSYINLYDQPFLVGNLGALVDNNPKEKELKLLLANLSTTEKYGEPEEKYFALFCVWNEFGPFIKEQDPDLYKGLKVSFLSLSYNYGIHPTLDGRVMWVPTCFKYEPGVGYQMQEFTVQLQDVNIKREKELLAHKETSEILQTENPLEIMNNSENEDNKIIKNDGKSENLYNSFRDSLRGQFDLLKIPVSVLGSALTPDKGYYIKVDWKNPKLSNMKTLFELRFEEVNKAIQLKIIPYFQGIPEIDPASMAEVIQAAYHVVGGRDELIKEASNFLKKTNPSQEKQIGDAKAKDPSEISSSRERTSSFGASVLGMFKRESGAKKETSSPASPKNLKKKFSLLSRKSEKKFSDKSSQELEDAMIQVEEKVPPCETTNDSKHAPWPELFQSPPPSLPPIPSNSGRDSTPENKMN